MTRLQPKDRILSRAQVAGTRRLILVASLVVGVIGVLVGCGDRRLILKVDVLSFLSPNETQTSYGPIPPGTSGSIALSQDTEVNLLTGLGGVVNVETLEFFVTGIFDHRNGDGQATICVIFSDIAGGAVDSLSVPVTLVAGQADTVQTRLQGSQALANLFSGEELTVTLRVDLDADPNGAALQGDIRLTELMTVLTTRRDSE